ncbi:MAG TPA: hypothetical protein EYQ26_07295 [Rhodospirillales bacterium]|nr:hypothetical protein [Rhodospirillales bacterium]
MKMQIKIKIIIAVLVLISLNGCGSFRLHHSDPAIDAKFAVTAIGLNVAKDVAVKAVDFTSGLYFDQQKKSDSDQKKLDCLRTTGNSFCNKPDTYKDLGLETSISSIRPYDHNKKLEGCRAIRESGARLNCYDTTKYKQLERTAQQNQTEVTQNVAVKKPSSTNMYKWWRK